MATQIHPLYLLMVGLVALGFIGNSFEFFTQEMGWPVNSRVASWAVHSIVMVPFSVGTAWYFEGWLAALVALVGGFVLAYLLTHLLHQYVQVLWAVSIVAVFVSVATIMLVRLVN
jgi:hypothetical protein